MVAVAGGIASAAPTPPTDAYAKKLAGKTIDDGKGFPGIVAIGDPSPEMFKALGPGRETAEAPFWYFYDKGSWTLVVVAEIDAETGSFVTRAIQVSGDRAPATSKGVRVGDAVKKITSAYGAGQPFTSTVGSPMLANLVSVDLATGKRTPLPDLEKAYKDSLYYPALGMLFVVGSSSKVSRIVVLVGEDPLPVFLREHVKPSTTAVIDPKLDEPDYVQGKLHVPAVPPLVPAHEVGFWIDVPKGWIKADGKWSDPGSKESVEVKESTATNKPAEFFAEAEKTFGVNHVSPSQRELPAQLAAELGADAAYALSGQEPSKGKHGKPLRSFVLMAAKGDRRFVIVVTRTVSGAETSPDGEALARGVLRSFRIK